MTGLDTSSVAASPRTSKYAALAKLRLGDALFYQDRYAEATEVFRGFTNQYKSDPNLPYARFKVAQCYYERIPGEWFPAPPIADSILFNSGDMLTRWTNGRFLSTPHRVINRSGRDRYSIPLFVHPNPSFVIECLPTCTGPDNPPKEPPISSGDYLEWFMGENFKHAAKDKPGTDADTR